MFDVSFDTVAIKPIACPIVVKPTNVSCNSLIKKGLETPEGPRMPYKATFGSCVLTD